MVRSLVNAQKRSIFTKISTHGPRKPTIHLLSEAVPEMAWTIQVTAITRNWKYKCQSLYNNNYDYIMYLWAILLYSVAYSSGSMTSVAPLQFSLTADPSVFTLNCITTGGPPTVTWTRDGNNVPYDATHVLTQTVTDQENVIYSNVLTVTGSESGIYTCIVTNDRTAPPIVSQELTVVGE